MEVKNIEVYTELGRYFPPFISINEIDGERIEITVRSDKPQEHICGNTSTVVMSKEEFKKLLDEMNKNFNGDFLEKFAKDLASKQEPLGDEFKKILYDNLEDLYVKD
jgi:hypothetical protein